MINNLADVHEVLKNLAYPARLFPDSVSMTLGMFPVLFTINSKSELVISCPIAKLGSIDEERLTEFAFAALDANSRLSPFAISIITEDGCFDGDCFDAVGEESTEEFDYPIVLVDNIPLGDLCTEELSKAVDSLHAAILGCREVLEAGVIKSVTACSCNRCE